MIRIDLFSDGIGPEVDRLSNGPTLSDLLNFETVLQNQFNATQSVVHRITSSLALSGKLSSSVKNNSWEGEITYGGQSEGIHNPVDYAEYERERDGAHDFFRPLEGLSEGYVAALESFLRG